MNRTTLSLIGAAAALAAVTGVAALTRPGRRGHGAPRPPARLPVQRSTLLCPAPSSSDLTDDVHLVHPEAGAAAAGGQRPAGLLPAESGRDEPTDEGRTRDSGARGARTPSRSPCWR